MDRFEVHLRSIDQILPISEQCIKCQSARVVFHAVMMAVVVKAYEDPMRLQSLLVGVIPPDLKRKGKK